MMLRAGRLIPVGESGGHPLTQKPASLNFRPKNAAMIRPPREIKMMSLLFRIDLLYKYHKLSLMKFLSSLTLASAALFVFNTSADAKGQAGQSHGKAGQIHGKAGQNGQGALHGQAGQKHGKAGEKHGKAGQPHDTTGEIEQG